MPGGGLWRLEAACYRAVIAVEEEGEPKDPVVEAALDQGLGTRKRGLGGLLTDFQHARMPTMMMSKTIVVIMIFTCMSVNIASMVARV